MSTNAFCKELIDDQKLQNTNVHCKARITGGARFEVRFDELHELKSRFANPFNVNAVDDGCL